MMIDPSYAEASISNPFRTQLACVKLLQPARRASLFRPPSSAKRNHSPFPIQSMIEHKGGGGAIEMRRIWLPIVDEPLLP
jgi:hypothetical protein